MKTLAFSFLILYLFQVVPVNRIFLFQSLFSYGQPKKAEFIALRGYLDFSFKSKTLNREIRAFLLNISLCAEN